MVVDGGDRFFEVIYDFDQESFSNLLINGNA
jgi:hypothetical protein